MSKKSCFQSHDLLLSLVQRCQGFTKGPSRTVQSRDALPGTSSVTQSLASWERRGKAVGACVSEQSKKLTGESSFPGEKERGRQHEHRCLGNQISGNSLLPNTSEMSSIRTQPRKQDLGGLWVGPRVGPRPGAGEGVGAWAATEEKAASSAYQQ